MAAFFKSKRILLSDVAPQRGGESETGLVIAGIGILSAAMAIAAMLLVFFRRLTGTRLPRALAK